MVRVLCVTHRGAHGETSHRVRDDHDVVERAALSLEQLGEIVAVGR
ncbi:MAG: hypothetical protein M3Y87_11940 [Myxococcota bacterium]|nr:hypothetical protein [Myxococcota bacterium]